MLKQILDRFPSIGCAYVDGAGKVNTEYYGADENTIFPAASMSKFVTALCLMKLYEDQTIDINAPVNVWLKQWKLRTPDGQESDAAHDEDELPHRNRFRGDDKPQPGDGSVRIRCGVAL